MPAFRRPRGYPCPSERDALEGRAHGPRSRGPPQAPTPRGPSRGSGRAGARRGSGVTPPARAGWAPARDGAWQEVPFASERVPVAAVDREDRHRDADDRSDQDADPDRPGEPTDQSSERDAGEEHPDEDSPRLGVLERGSALGLHAQPEHTKP